MPVAFRVSPDDVRGCSISDYRSPSTGLESSRPVGYSINGNSPRPPKLPAEKSSREAVWAKEIPHGRILWLYSSVIRVNLRAKLKDIEPFRDAMSNDSERLGGPDQMADTIRPGCCEIRCRHEEVRSVASSIGE